MDPKQLPPVNERISVTFLLKDCFELTDIIRQAHDNPLMEVLNLLVKDIDNNSADFLRYLIANRNRESSTGEGYKLIINKEEFSNIAIEHFKSNEFSKNPDYARIANWKNNTVNEYNHLIRHNILPYFSNSLASELEIVDINDVFIGYKTLQDEYNSTTIINSEDYLVKSIKPETHYNFKCLNVELTTRAKRVPVEILIVDHSDSNFVMYQEKIKSLYFKALYSPQSARKNNWKNYFEFKNKYLILKSFDVLQNGQVKTTIAKDIDYAFALTTHKLQGSTINRMFVDLYDMLYFTNGSPVLSFAGNPYATETRNKLIYTAISRASEFAYIYFPLSK